MAAKFEVSSNGKGGFKWILSSQGRTLAFSEPYSRKASCLNAIDSLRKAAATATVSDGTVAAPSAATANAAAARNLAEMEGFTMAPWVGMNRMLRPHR